MSFFLQENFYFLTVQVQPLIDIDDEEDSFTYDPDKLLHKKIGILDTLKPRIPRSGLPSEDRRTPRVCLSTSIWGCIDAIGRERLISMIEEQREIDEKRTGQPKGLKCDLYTIPASSLDDSKIIDPAELYQFDKVRDAFVTDEHWYLDTIEIINQPETFYVIDIDWTESCVFIVSNDTIDEYLKKQQLSFNYETYDDLINDMNCYDDKKEVQEIYPAFEIYLADGSVMTRKNSDIDALYYLPPYKSLNESENRLKSITW